MFNPVPVPLANSLVPTNHVLEHFRARVLVHASKHGINLENRYVGLLTCCDSISKYIASCSESKTAIWDTSTDEITETLEDKLQILIYLIGDEGLLFNKYGLLNDFPAEDSWRMSKDKYYSLAFAMRNRHFANLELAFLRRYLEYHDRQDREGASSNKRFKPEYTPLLTRLLYDSLNDIVDRQTIKDAVTLLSSDRLFSHAKSIFLFFAISSDIPVKLYNSVNFKNDLKRTSGRFIKPKQPKQVLSAKKNCDLFSAIDTSVHLSESYYSTSKRCQFEPFSLLVQIRQKSNLSFSNATLAKIAHLCYKFSASSKTPESSGQSFDIKINNVDILDILHAFYILFESQTTTSKSNDRIRPRAWKQSLRTLSQAQLLSGVEINSDPQKITDEEYDKMQKAVFAQYSTPVYSLSQEAFWLLSGYVPPYNYPYPPNDNELYALVHRQLENLFSSFSVYISKHTNERVTSFQLHSDILKAKEFWAKHWTEAKAQEFCNQISSFNGPAYSKQNLTLLIEWIKAEYTSLSMPKQSSNGRPKKSYSKSSFKSFDTHPEVMYEALLEESFLLTSISIREAVFSTLSSVSNALWPSPLETVGKTSSVSSQADASLPEL